jgi:hypothetical protein
MKPNPISMRWTIGLFCGLSLFTTTSAIAICLLALTGCDSGTGAGNPSPNATVALRMHALDAGRAGDDSVAFTDKQGTRFTVREASAEVKHIRFDFPDSLSCTANQVTAPLRCDSERVALEVPLSADLVTGKTTPDLGNLNLPVGLYKRIDVRFASPSDAKPTLHIKATFTDAKGQPQGLALTLDFNEDMRFESNRGVALAEGRATAWVLGLKLDQWMKDTDITKCIEANALPRNALGDFVIDEDVGGECGDLEKTIKDNLKQAGDLSVLP